MFRPNTTKALQLPPFDETPDIEGQPKGCLWGFFDKDGVKDECGTLDLLSDDVVREAAKEIVFGKHLQLDWSLDNAQFPAWGRKRFSHTVIDQASKGFVAFDDEIFINTQSGSQWDSLKHYGIQADGLFYNGLTTAEAATSDRNGTHNICKMGGIVGRGVFVDWVRWWETQNPGKACPSPTRRYEISVLELEAVLKFQGTTTRQGDILIIRSGYVRWHDGATTEERKKETPQMIGVAGNMETVRWLYSKHFAAVAGDAVTFEAWPPSSSCCLHEWVLARWGTPIGEMWNLEELSMECVKLKRWSFFLTSAPLHVKGGVGSPPGVIAIF